MSIIGRLSALLHVANWQFRSFSYNACAKAKQGEHVFRSLEEEGPREEPSNQRSAIKQSKVAVV